MTLDGAATPDGTAAYAARHPAAAAGHFRTGAGGLSMSSIGAGTYLGNPDPRVDAGYDAALECALRSGVNVVDTAVNYRDQRSERTAGTVLRRLHDAGALHREEVVIATKGGFLPGDSGRPGGAGAYVEQELMRPGVIEGRDVVAGCHCMTPAYLRHQLAASLANLGLAAVDVYFVHNPETQLQEVSRAAFDRRIRDAFAALEEEVAAGRAGVYGVATWSGLRAEPGSADHLSLRALLDAARDAGGGDAHHFRALQLPLNLAMPEAVALRNQRGDDGTDTTVLEMAEANGMTVLASASLLQGRLSGGLPDPLRAALGAELRSDAQRALQFTRSAPGLTTALVGMSDPAHAEENCAVAQVEPLAAERFRTLFVPR